MRSDAPLELRSVFVIGTDTGVGKSLVSAALLRGAVQAGLRAVGMKPVAAGLDAQLDGSLACGDVLALQAAGNVAADPALVNPFCLPDPLSPHLAARRAGRRITLAPIVAAHRALCVQADRVIVEGAGGFLVPLDEGDAGEAPGAPLLTGADLAQALGVPLVLVVGLRLGCLNHALLTAEAVRARGLTLAGWVANRIDPAMACADENLDFLRRHIPAPLLADVPHASCWPEGWQPSLFLS
jgi:dethiobiotin synthetase